MAGTACRAAIKKFCSRRCPHRARVSTARSPIVGVAPCDYPLSCWLEGRHGVPCRYIMIPFSPVSRYPPLRCGYRPCESFDRHVVVVGWIGVTGSIPSIALRKPTHQYKRHTFNRWVGYNQVCSRACFVTPTHPTRNIILVSISPNITLDPLLTQSISNHYPKLRSSILPDIPFLPVFMSCCALTNFLNQISIINQNFFPSSLSGFIIYLLI